MEEVYVLDASALILGCIPPGKRLIPAAVASELRSEQQRGIEAGEIAIASPSERQVIKARKTAKNTGDLPVLSPADIEVLAVALGEMENGRFPLIVSDDYAVQNVASALGIKTTPVGQPGISRRLHWEWYCLSCGESTGGAGEGRPCPRCGSVRVARRRK